MAQTNKIPIKQSIVLTDAEVAAASDNHTHCLVCYSDLTFRGKAPCQHDDICGVCHLRLRFLHNDKKCPICKAENERLIVDSDASKRYDEYPMWGDEIGSNFTFQQDVGVFFENIYYEQEILPLFGNACQKCDYTPEQETQPKHPPLRLLQDHLRTEHRLSLCSLCVDHKRDFVARLPRFTPNQLQKHLRQGDGPTSGFFGHPVCEFCKPKRFYDLAYLHQHLHKEHYKCHVCEKQGIDNQFFKNYKSLEKHFDQMHFLCHDVQCLAARFVVFENELDLRGHELSVHGGTSTGSTKINLEFRTRRAGYDGSGIESEEQTPPSEADFNYGLDGQAFVPQALPNPNAARSPDGIQLHPLHLQRTQELRAQAAAIREQQAALSEEDSFPTLQSAVAGTSSAPLVGWSSGTTLQRVNRPKKEAGKVTEDDFPSLGPAPSAASNATKKAIKGSVAATQRQFATMTTAASRPASSGWGAAAAVPSPQTQRSTFTANPPPAAAATLSREVDLAAENFPALGPSANARPTYVAAHNLAKKTQQPQQRQPPAPPSIDSTIDFPTVAAANKPHGDDNKAKSVRDRVLGNGTPSSNQHAMASNILDAPVTKSATATLEEMKALLGPNKFKQLKRLTKEFAEGTISPEGYVDQSAVLFDRGYADTDFWAFLPTLLESCPNTEASDHALRYMTSLKKQQYAEKPAVPKAKPAVANSGPSWGGGAGLSNVAKPPPMMAAPVTTRVPAYAAAPRPMAPPPILAGKKKSAWGGTGAATVIRAKAPPGSVAVAAATQGPQGGSATKFMAKETKQQTAANAKNAVNGNKQQQGKKGKQKDELRSLAFGGK